MNLCFIDDSIPFDGHTPGQWAMDGMQRAIASLAPALARRGHDVTVVCRTTMDRWIEGVRWVPHDSVLKTSYDLVVACRKPSLFERFAETLQAKRRLLWWTADPTSLTNQALAAGLREWNVDLMLVGAVQRQRYHGMQTAFVVAPGVERVFLPQSQDPLADKIVDPVGGPVAIVTGHPDHGLETLIELWKTRIRPEVPTAQLHIYSSLLSKPEAVGAPVPDAYTALYDTILAAAQSGVHVRTPKDQAGMARVYQTARVHLHVGHGQEFACWTIAESQACGLPVVGTMTGGLPDRVVNGQTGYLVPDDAALANVAIQVLGNDAVHDHLSQAAADVTRRRSWDTAASEFERYWLEAAPSGVSAPVNEPSDPASSEGGAVPEEGAQTSTDGENTPS